MSSSSSSSDLNSSDSAMDLSLLFFDSDECAREMEEALTEHKLQANISSLIYNTALHELIQTRHGSNKIISIVEYPIYNNYLPAILDSLGEEFIPIFKHKRASSACRVICLHLSKEQLCCVIDKVDMVAEEYAMDKNAAFVLQTILKRAEQFLDYVSANSRLDAMLARLVALGMDLVSHKYGNYTAQVMIACLGEEQLSKFTQVVVQNFSECCSSIFGSHVVEALLVKGNDETRAKITHAVCACGSSTIALCRDWKFVCMKARNFITDLTERDFGLVLQFGLVGAADALDALAPPESTPNESSDTTSQTDSSTRSQSY